MPFFQEAGHRRVSAPPRSFSLGRPLLSWVLKSPRGIAQFRGEDGDVRGSSSTSSIQSCAKSIGDFLARPKMYRELLCPVQQRGRPSALPFRSSQSFVSFDRGENVDYLGGGGFSDFRLSWGAFRPSWRSRAHPASPPGEILKSWARSAAGVSISFAVS